MTPTEITLTKIREEYEAPLRARIAELEKALRPFAEYAAKRDAQPLRGMDDIVHSIHMGTPYFAELTMRDCREARRVLAS